jgi:SAM-dependent methyltransferase
MELVLPIKPSALADAYIPKERLMEIQPRFPLDVYLCGECGHVQILEVVDPVVLFQHYLYTTSGSLGLVEHFRSYVADALQRLGVRPSSLAVDIGSNEGVLLRHFKAAGLRVLGVDAAQNIAAAANAAGIETIPEFFTADLAGRIVRERGPVALVTANNVFAHADNLGDMADGIRDLLAPDGVFIFEVIYLVDLIQKFTFDTIYHEHLSYHSVGPFRAFFQRHGMELFDIQRIPTKGGSIRGFAQRAGGPRAVTPQVEELIKLEARLGLNEAAAYREFDATLEAIKGQLVALLRSLRQQGKAIAGYGASATVTTLIHHFELGELIDFIVDDNPSRQNLYSPGFHIPVLPPDTLASRKPDFVVILAWQYADPIIRKNEAYLRAGGKFIRPLPHVGIV